MSETTAKNMKAGLLTLAAALGALLLILAIEMISTRPASATVSVSIPENGTYDPSSGTRTNWVGYTTVSPGEKVVIDADPNARIWSGVWFTGQNGPAGWDRCDSSTKFPLTNYLVSTRTGTCSRPYSLIGKVYGDVFYVGQHKEYTYKGQEPSWLLLGINDDVVGNGSGAFQATITKYRGG